jgi:excisionase family DNA binding protein
MGNKTEKCDGKIKKAGNGLSQVHRPGDFLERETMKESEYMTTKEIAAMLNVSKRTVDRMIKTRKLPYVRIVHQYRIKKSHFDEFIRRNSRNVEGYA